MDKNKPYYLRFILSTTPLPNISVEAVMNLEDTIILFNTTRSQITLILLQGFKNKPVSVINITNFKLSQQFNALQEYARELKRDRQTIRKHLNDKSNSLYIG